MHRIPSFSVSLVLLLVPLLAAGDDRQEINQALDAFHRAAATADYPAYVGLMTEDVVFLGTDGKERWQGAEFRDFARPRFENGDGWVYVPVSRNVDISTNGDVAWFDEALENASLGNCRGSGMLLREKGSWLIVQYNLSVPIPNELVDGVVEQIAAFETDPAAALSTTAAAGESVSTDDAEDKNRRDSNCSQRRHKTNRKAGC